MGRTGAAMSSRPSGRAAMGRAAIRTAKAALEAEHAAAARAKAEQAVAAGSQEQDQMTGLAMRPQLTTKRDQLHR